MLIFYTIFYSNCAAVVIVVSIADIVVRITTTGRTMVTDAPLQLYKNYNNINMNIITLIIVTVQGRIL